jgi:hypothetical protein
MNSEQIAIATLVFVGGACVLGSYVPIALNAKKFDYWFGASKNLTRALYVFWAAAAAGFLLYTLSIVFGSYSAPAKGLFSYWPWTRVVLIALLLAGSIGWSACVYGYSKSGTTINAALTSSCLAIVAVATVLLLAGEFERDAPVHTLVGLLLFATTPVLVDAVGWNSNFLLQHTRRTSVK